MTTEQKAPTLADKYEGKSIAELAQALSLVKAQYKAVSDAKTSLQKEQDYLSKTLIPDVMDSMGVQTVTLKGIGRLSLRADAYCNIVAGKKEALFEWLRENELPELISETVNSSTLKAFMKEQINEGNNVPSDDIVSFTPYTMASLTKA